jgi:chromosome segregation ATPase
MDLSDPYTIIAISALITAISAIITAYLSRRNVAKVDALRVANKTIDTLINKADLYEGEIKDLHEKYDSLWRTLQNEREEWSKQTKMFKEEISDLKDKNVALKKQLDSLEGNNGR